MNVATTFHHPLPFRAMAALALLMTAGLPCAPALAGTGKDGPGEAGWERASALGRAIEANAQMKAYRERLEFRRSADRGEHSVGRDVEVRLDAAAKTASTVFFFDNMEAGTNGWTTAAYTGADLWHQTTLDASSPSHSWWPGNDLLGTYGTGARINGAAVSPAVNLAGAVGPLTLLFTENFYTERGWDYCMVDVSTDGGGSWIALRPCT